VGLRCTLLRLAWWPLPPGSVNEFLVYAIAVKFSDSEGSPNTSAPCNISSRTADKFPTQTATVSGIPTDVLPSEQAYSRSIETRESREWRIALMSGVDPAIWGLSGSTPCFRISQRLHVHPQLPRLKYLTDVGCLCNSWNPRVKYLTEVGRSWNP
jgi:hypothetical protein